jgi:hypothetical protein
MFHLLTLILEQGKRDLELNIQAILLRRICMVCLLYGHDLVYKLGVHHIELAVQSVLGSGTRGLA